MPDTPKIFDREKFRKNVVKALLLGVIGSIAVEMLSVRTSLDLHFIDIFIALIVLGVVQHDAGEETLKIRLLSMGLMAVSLLAANLVLIAYTVHTLRSGPHGDPNASFGNSFVPVLQSLGLMHWVWLIITLAAAFDLLKGTKLDTPSKPPAEKS